MGGFGEALKQLSIGFASQKGKAWIYTAGNITDWERMDGFLANQEILLLQWMMQLRVLYNILDQKKKLLLLRLLLIFQYNVIATGD